MPTVDSLTVAFNDAASAGAQAATSAMVRLADAMDRAAQSAATTDQAVTRRGPSFESVAQKIDGAAAATARLDAIERTYASRAGVLTSAMTAQGASATQIADALGRLSTLRDQDAAKAKAQGQAIEDRFRPAAEATERLGQSAGAASAMMRNLGVQGIQAASGIATGQPVMTVLIQQGHQVVDSMLAMGTGFGGLGTAAKAAYAAVGGLWGVVGIGAVVGGIALLSSAGNQQEEMMAHLRTSLRATQDSYASLADTVAATGRRVAASSTLSTSDATSTAATLAGAKYFAGTATDLERLTRDAADLGVVLGGKAADGAKAIRDAMDDTAKAAQSLAANGFRSMTPDLLRQIELYQQGGKSAQAFALYLQAVESVAHGVAQQNTTQLSQAWTQFQNTLTGTNTVVSSLGSAFDTLFSKIISGTATAISALNDLNSTRRVHDMSTAAPDAVPLIDPSTGEAFSPLSQSGRTGTQSFDPARAATIRDNLTVDLNITSAQAAGIVSNLVAESGLQGINELNPASGRGGFGWAQWTGSRRTSFEGYASGQGLDPASDQANYGYLVQDLRGSYSDTLTKIRSAGSAAAAATEFFHGYESGGAPGLEAKLPGHVAYADSVAALKGTVYNYPQPATGDAASTIINTQRSTLDTANKAAESLDLLVDRRAKLIAQRDGFAAALQVPGRTDEEYARFNQGLAATNGLLNDALTPAQAYIRSLKDQAGPTAALTEGDKVLADVRQHIAEIERASGQNFSEAEKREAEAAAITNSSNALKGLEADMGRQVMNSTALAAAYGQGSDAVLQATAQQQAYQTLLGKFPQDAAAIQAALPDLTTKYAALAVSAAEAQQAQQNAQARDNLTYIQAETATIGMNEDARARQLAVLKTEMDLRQKHIGLETLEGQEAIRLAGATAEATAAYQHQQQSLQELSGFFSNAFDTISTAITQAFATGQLAALKFGDIAKSVASAVISEFAKLAILNPIKNWLFNGSDPTLSSVGGVVGSLFGGGGAVAAAVAGGSALANLAGGSGSDPFSATATGITAAGSASSSGSSTLQEVGVAGGLLKNLYSALGGGGSSGGGLISTISDKILSGIGWRTGDTLGTYTSHLLGETPVMGGNTGLTALGGQTVTSGLPDGVGNAAAQAVNSAAIGGDPFSVAATGGFDAVTTGATAATDGFSAAATGAGAAADGLSVSATGATAAVDAFSEGAAGIGSAVAGAGAATNTFSAALEGAGAAVGTATNAAVGTIGSAVSTVAAAIPYVAAAATVIMDLVNGNYRGAGLVLAGAAIGTAIAPGIGTAVGAAVGEIVDMLLPNHPKHPYENTEVDVKDGHLVAGQQYSQLLSADESKAQVDTFSAALDKFMGAVGIKIGNADGRIGDIGTGITGLQQTTDINTLFNRFGFIDTDQNGTNWSVSKEALNGMTFGSFQELGTFMEKIAGVADAMDVVGIHLKAVDKNFASLVVGSVDTDGSDLRTALNADLSNKSFAGIDALDAEIDKVNTFVNSTVPGLIDATLSVGKSSVVQQTDQIATQYQDVINQEHAYGITSQDSALAATRDRLMNQVLQPSLLAIRQTEAQTTDAYYMTTGGTSQGYQKAMDDFEASAEQQRVAYRKQWTDAFGDAGTTYTEYLQGMVALEQTLGAERVAAAQAAAYQIAQAQKAIVQTGSGYQARLYAANGDQESADLINYDVKAEQETDAFTKQWTDFYGQSITSNGNYLSQLNLVEQTHAAERQAIITKYADATAQALQQKLDQAAQQDVSVAKSLSQYVTGLETSSASPLSAQDQLRLAQAHFETISTQAVQGDYTAYSSAQSAADTFLTAAKAAYGSTQGYTDAFGEVLSRLADVANVNQDTLTASTMASIAQSNTDQLVAELQALRGDVATLRVAMAQAGSAPARVA